MHSFLSIFLNKILCKGTPINKKTFILWLLSTGEDTSLEISRKCLSTSLSGDVKEKETRKTNKKQTKMLIN